MATNSENVVNTISTRLKTKDQVLEEILDEGDEVATASNYTELKDKAKKKDQKLIDKKNQLETNISGF